MSTAKAKRRTVQRIGIAVLMLGLVAAIAVMIYSFLSKPAGKKAHVQQISVLRPPPPPPPPKPEEKPPEVKKEEVKIEEPKPIDQPKEAESPQPEGKQLGLDAEGGAGSDGFGLIGNKGGRDVTAGGKGGYQYYAGLVQRELFDALQKDKKLRGEEFRVVVSLWLKPDGRVDRAEVVGSSGKAATDEIIRVALNNLPPLKEGPPSEMPQPIKIRLANRF